MAVFSYTIKSKEGQIVKGHLEAESKGKAIEYLHGQGSMILALNKEKKQKIRTAKRGSVKVDELVVFSRQLTTLIESGIPIVNALDILYEQTPNPYFKRIIGLVLKDLKEGSSFAGAIVKYPDIFSELYVSMIQAAETSGNLPEILERLSVYLEKSSALRKKVISSLTYPAVVIIMAILITSFLIFKVIPSFKDIFRTLGGTLPLPTQILIGFSDFLRGNVLWLGAIIVVIVVAFKKYISTPRGMRQFHYSLLKMPLVGDIVTKVSIAKFARTFATLVRSGVPFVGALDIVGKTSGNKIVEEAVMKSKQSIQEGVPISEPLSECPVFPPMVVKMIGVGEKTGKLEQMLSKIAEFYEEQTEIVIASLTSLIEPLVIAFLGVVVGGIVIALFLPIIQITRMLS